MARRNPLRSEAEAFHWLLVTIAAFAVVALASLLGGWPVGLPVWIVVTIGAVVWYLRSASDEPRRQTAEHVGAPDEKRVLVIANETLASDELLEAVRRSTEGRRSRVLVVAPALSSRLRHWTSDEDPGRAQAQHRLDASLARLRAMGIDATGEVGDADPVHAIEDALRTFGADQIVVATHPEGSANWLERREVEQAERRFAVPIRHVVVDATPPPSLPED